MHGDCVFICLCHLLAPIAAVAGWHTMPTRNLCMMIMLVAVIDVDVQFVVDAAIRSSSLWSCYPIPLRSNSFVVRTTTTKQKKNTKQNKK